MKSRSMLSYISRKNKTCLSRFVLISCFDQLMIKKTKVTDKSLFQNKIGGISSDKFKIMYFRKSHLLPRKICIA